MACTTTGCFKPGLTKWGGACRSCYEKQLRASNPEFAERQRENCRRWAAKNREKLLQSKRNYAKLPGVRERKRNATRKRLFESYGVTVEFVDAQLQRGCQVCGSFERLHVDHDHTTGFYRGILCSKCNKGLGLFGDTVEGIEAALNYLRKERTWN